MKVERSSSARPARSVARAAYARRIEAAGDAVLSHFAHVLLAHTRDSDCVGRLGGDEFGVLLSHANQEQALKKADVLAAALEASPTSWNGHSISISFAYGAFDLKSGDNPDTAMARADQAMYAQKKLQRSAAE
jgi:diguanylate cyclase (GGDEF)-like protein